MNFTDKDLKQSLDCLSDITVFLNTGSCPAELVLELQERQLELINQVSCGSRILLAQTVGGK
ncbi:hypothetical protein [Vibrio parahaemolyticus]|uniref:hypothetical protein n=1 Tax=Vibrio parahaemolyticus TaxID=670 RepID=UPI00038E2EB3|nr:hypothetical protein [Vibrio parahaemolyticus]ANQ56084.1 hypothetical protein AB831_07850 [Vibrio parahaemolyticus]ASO15988.1 hypothetical protein BGM07_017270 [Vibrio parahaemolyticus]EGQ7717215.1 hypothetical protein [Vibrio parahaemolyticus]EGQ7721923.1 hypothetical protein [Vibrio parahaemolyticus]EGQ7726590.1 hypothetical protein [Vibrio parahaemolyticus]